MKTVRDLIEELKAYPQGLEILTDGFCVPELDLATVSDFDEDAANRTGRLPQVHSSKRQVLAILAGDDERRTVRTGKGKWENQQPHYIQYEYDGGILRS